MQSPHPPSSLCWHSSILKRKGVTDLMKEGRVWADPDVKEEEKIGHVAKVKEVAASAHGKFSMRKVTLGLITDMQWDWLKHSSQLHADRVTACRQNFLHVELADTASDTTSYASRRCFPHRAIRPMSESGSHDQAI